MALISTPALEFGKPLHSFILPTVDGMKFSSDNLTQSLPVVIMFICNHCPYVKAIEDRLITLGQDLKNEKISAVAICSNDSKNYPDDSREMLLQRSREKKYSFVYLHDESQEVAKAFGAVCTPDFFVYDRQHHLAYRGRLDDSWKDPALVTNRELYQATLDLLAGKKISTEQTPSMGCSIKWKTN